ncbi:MAG: nickel pincer cofactor biosynthesis protein LarC [Elainellaceae cyanobacterium]
MAIAYFDCPTGIAGDMCLGALLDAGLPFDHLSAQLAQLGIQGEYELALETVHRQGQRATKLWVRLQSAGSPADAPSQATEHEFIHGHSHGPGHEHNHGHKHTQEPQSAPAYRHVPSRHLPEILHLIHQANLPARVKAQSSAVFQRLAQAEAQVHGIPPEQVHFHEVGAVDAIVDIVGTCIALDWFDVDQLYCSALPTGGGMVRAAHGRLPVPAPAVLQLWQQRQVPVYSNGIQRELVTPTGAALAVALAAEFGPPPPMALRQVGLGAGAAELPIPNALRVWIGDESSTAASQGEIFQGALPLPTLGQIEPVAVLETQVDDLNPQVIGYLFERLLTAGALDVFTQAVGMKKSRPGILITVICRSDRVTVCEEILFQETSTLGIRRRPQQRIALDRSIETVATPYGPVRVKVARSEPNGAVVNAQPEYEDCANLARTHNLALQAIQKQTLLSWTAQTSVDLP